MHSISPRWLARSLVAGRFPTNQISRFLTNLFPTNQISRFLTNLFPTNQISRFSTNQIGAPGPIETRRAVGAWLAGWPAGRLFWAQTLGHTILEGPPILRLFLPQQQQRCLPAYWRTIVRFRIQS